MPNPISNMIPEKATANVQQCKKELREVQTHKPRVVEGVEVRPCLNKAVSQETVVKFTTLLQQRHAIDKDSFSSRIKVIKTFVMMELVEPPGPLTPHQRAEQVTGVVDAMQEACLQQLLPA